MWNDSFSYRTQLAGTVGMGVDVGVFVGLGVGVFDGFGVAIGVGLFVAVAVGVALGGNVGDTSATSSIDGDVVALFSAIGKDVAVSSVGLSSIVRSVILTTNFSP